MSAHFILEYAGAPVRLDSSNTPELVTEREATAFACEADGWRAAARSGLNLNRVEIVNLFTRYLETHHE